MTTLTIKIETLPKGGITIEASSDGEPSSPGEILVSTAIKAALESMLTGLAEAMPNSVMASGKNMEAVKAAAKTAMKVRSDQLKNQGNEELN